jgi:hypothetical protein
VRDGYLVLRVDDVPNAVHRRLYEAVRISSKGTVTEAGLERLAAETGRPRHPDAALPVDAPEQLGAAEKAQAARDFAEIGGSETILGAAHSLLGADFCGSLPDPAAGTVPGGSMATISDNAHHKDATRFPVREHRLRAVGYWYYPMAVTLEMGPTCVVPRSQYWAVDRDTFPHSEERLDQALRPPKTLREWRAALVEWSGFSLGMHGAADPKTGRRASGELPVAVRDERIVAGLRLLGDPAAADVRLLVPAGSVVLKHNEIFHRVSRSGLDGRTNHDVPARFMLGGGFFRGSEPVRSGPATQCHDSALFAADAVAHPVWSANLGWLRDGRAGRWSCPGWRARQPVERAAAAMAASPSEAERTAAGYRLGGSIRRGGAGRAAAVAALVAGLVSGGEATQRAATYGLSVAGQAAVAPLLSVVAAQLEREGDEAAGGGDVPAVGLHGGRWQIITCACFALGEASERPSAPAVAAMARVLEQATQGIVAHLAAKSGPQSAGAEGPRVGTEIRDATVEVDWAVHERRRAAAQAAAAAGHLGHAAVLADDAPVALTALAVLAPWLGSRDELEYGGELPDYFSGSAIGQAASHAALLLVSVRLDRPALLPAGNHWPGARGGAVAQEALRRLEHAVASGVANGAQRALHRPMTAAVM